MRQLLGIALLLLGSAGTSSLHAGVFWSDSFEYPSQSDFEAVWPTSCPGASNVMGPSAEFSVSPSRSLRSVQNGGAASCYVDRSYPRTNHVFYRWYLHLSPGYDLETVCSPTGSCPGGNGSKQMYAKAIPAGYLVYFHLEPGTHELRMNAPHGGYSVMCPSGPGMPVGSQPNEECVFKPNKANIPIVPGNTYCVETELVRSSPGLADGVGRIWINGTLTLEYTNVAMARSDEGSSGFNDLTHYSQAGYGTRHIDDLAVGDTRIGCGALPPPDTQVPPPPPPPGAVGAVSDLAVPQLASNSATLSFTEVDDGTGQPAKYDIRFQSPTINWGSAPSVTQGTCASPLAGAQIGAAKTCTVLGLSPGTDYQFQLVPFRGTMNVDAVFGPVSNVIGARTSAAADAMPPGKPKNMRTQ